MTSKQKAAIKFNIKKEYEAGKITMAEYDAKVNELQHLYDIGASLQEANQQLGMYKTGAKAKTKKPMTDEEYSDLWSDIDDQYQAKKITSHQMKSAVGTLYTAYNSGWTKAKAESEIKKVLAATAPPSAPSSSSSHINMTQLNQLESQLAFELNSGFITPTEYLDKMDKLQEMYANKVSYEDAKAFVTGVQAPKGMTQDELTGLKSALAKKHQAGLITDAEYDALGKKLDKAYKGGKKVSDIEAEIGCDQGTLEADEKILKLGSKFEKVYGQAAKEIEADLKKLEAECGPEMRRLEKALADGTITPEEANWLKMQTLKKAGLEKKLDQATGVMLHANQKALAMTNGEQLHVFAENANYQAYQLEKDVNLNLSFAIYDENTVEKLIRDNPELLPRRVDVDGNKDKAWNKTKMSNAVAQAVIQGYSIPKLAKRIAAETGEANMKAMTRYARTAMTGAQNMGRIAMLHRAQDLGIQVKKVWLATLDSRTRDSHRHMDGVSAEVDKKFTTPLGSKMECPGDLAGKPGDVWNCRCTLTYDYEGFPYDPAENERIQYDEYYTEETDAKGKTHKVFHRESSVIKDMTYDEWKSVKEAGKMNDLNLAKADLSAAQKAVIKAKVDESKVYSGLWKQDVTLADYEAKKGGIPAKLDWYDQEIAKYKDAQQNGHSWATDAKIQDLEDKKKLLEEYRDHGELLAKRNEALEKVQGIYNTAGFTGTAKVPGAITYQAPASALAKKSQFSPDAWDDSTKKKARNFSTKEAADKVNRPDLDAIWDSLTDEEKYGVWLYTWNSNPMNKPLSGYHDGWDRSNFLGYANTDWGHEDNYSNRNISNLGEMKRFARSDGHAEYLKGITYATNAIEKSPLKEGQWLVRGSDENGLAGWFEGGGMDFGSVTALFNGNYTEKQMQQALVGKKAINHAFTSTGVATGSGFSGRVSYRIYAPKGTKGIYAEPQSHYGDTTGGYSGTPVPKNKQDRIYKKGQKIYDIGREAEIILQRGTTYRCTGLKVIGHDYQGRPMVEVEMEIVEQPDYFQHGDEDTYNGGKTRHKR